MRAIIFRKTKGHENLIGVQWHLEQFFGMIARRNVQDFDCKKAAKLELHWWMIDRYPQRYETDRAAALASAMAVIYGVPAKRLEIYGAKRAQAMLLIGNHHDDKTVRPDWSRIEALLIEAYTSLYAAVHI